MSYVDSSLDRPPSPLSGLSGSDAPLSGADLLAEDPEEQEEEREPAEPPAKDGTLKERLLAQIGDINLARYIDETTLNEIGERVGREFTIDENSRADWADKAEKAMDFALQKTEEKSYPWPRASNLIYPLIGQAAIQFAARTYPALIQNRSVVKGVVWGSDKGTPVMENGQPKMKAPAPMPVQPGPPPGGPGAQMTPGAAPPMAGAPPMQPGAPPQQGAPPEIEWLLAPGEKRLRADRVGEHMSYQLLVEMPYWEPQTDQLLHQIPIIGGAARKTYRDLVEEKNASMFVSLMNLVWDYNAPSFEAAPRHTEKVMLYPHEILEMERAGAGDTKDTDEGAFIHYDYGMAGGGNVAYGFNRNTDAGDQSDPDKPHLFLEQHRRLDLDGDGYPEPYVVTTHERSGKVVRITARYDKEGIRASVDGETILRVEAVDHYTLYPFLPSLDGGSYPVGFGHLLRPLNEAINTSLNQMFDAGHLQNSGAGFIASGMGMASGQVSLQVGKFQRVDTKGQSIKDSVLPIPFPGPSTVLFQLLGVLMTAGKEIASIQDVLAGDAGIANAPPTTVLALIEQGLKVYTAIIKRVFRAEKSELDKLFRLNRIYLKEKTSYRLGDEERDIEPSDYRIGGGVEPIADPTMVTDMQKLGRAQILLQLRGDPLMNPKKILERYLDAAMIDRPEDLFAEDQMAGVMQQLALAKAQAELGRERAAEAKDQTQAFLNLALARKNATAQEEVFIQAQMDFLRYHIEALNAATRAAQVDHSIHRTNLEHQRGQMQHALDAADMLIRAHQGEGGLPPQLQPDAQGPFPQAPVEPPPGPDITNAGSKGAGTPPGPDLVGGGGPLPGRAGGGNVTAGQPYTVGERGQEVVVPQQDSTVVPNMTDQYNTQLSPADEAKYQAWAAANHRQNDTYDYDMRGAWKAGAATDPRGHFPDTYKKPNHPTFSNESRYSGRDGFVGGLWDDIGGGKWDYVPSQTNLKFHGATGLHDYFQRVEPDARLVLPGVQAGTR